MRKGLFFILGLIIIIIFSMGLSACTTQSNSTAANADSTGATTTGAAATVSQATPLASIAGVVAKVKPSVVAINVQVTTFDFFNNPVQSQGAGSGWVIRSDGYIVTNDHVVSGATDIVVITNDGTKYSAQNVFTDTFTDLAVIKINAANLPALTTGDATAINVGDGVVAIGNALGQGISATSGIVSARDVSLTQSSGEPLDNLIQTDAAINPGNSGGPLVDMSGEVIGITSLKISQVGVEGMGYALSINQALPVINTLITSGTIVRPWLGISAFTVDAQVAAYYGLSANSGVLITNVTTGSPADNAGLHAGDVITAVNGNAQTDSGLLMTYINTLKVGQQITLTYVRGTQTNTVNVTLGQSPS